LKFIAFLTKYYFLLQCLKCFLPVQIDGPDFEGNILKKYVNSSKTEGTPEKEEEEEIKVKIEQPEEAF
jgi:hypothetical protein